MLKREPVLQISRAVLLFSMKKNHPTVVLGTAQDDGKLGFGISISLTMDPCALESSQMSAG